jgi:hypothetical protein
MSTNDARLQQVRMQAEQLAIAAVADHEAILGVVEREAVGGSFEAVDQLLACALQLRLGGTQHAVVRFERGLGAGEIGVGGHQRTLRAPQRHDLTRQHQREGTDDDHLRDQRHPQPAGIPLSEDDAGGRAQADAAQVNRQRGPSRRRPFARTPARRRSVVDATPPIPRSDDRPFPRRIPSHRERRRAPRHRQATTATFRPGGRALRHYRSGRTLGRADDGDS